MVLADLSCLPCQSATWLQFVVGGKRREKTKKAEMVNYCRFWRKTELEAFVVQMKIAHFLSAWMVGVKVVHGIGNKYKLIPHQSKEML